jgi:hypothetical protein
MKKLILLTFLMAAFIASSCQKGDLGGGLNDVAEVTLAVGLPEAVASKAIGDGKKAKIVYYAAFVDGVAVPALCQQVELDESGRAELKLQLVKKVNYSFVFWAQTPVASVSEQYYDLSSFYVDSKVKVNYAVNANDDLRDAFCALKEVCVDETTNLDVVLRRPFAQVNFLASDYDMLKPLGLRNGLLSEMTFAGIPDTITLLDGSVSSSSSAGAEVTFAAAAVPSGEDEYMTLLGQEYGYVGMNYILASEDGDNISVKGRFESGDATWHTDLIPNVPVRKNYRTNIHGEFFVEHGQLNILILPDFNSPDEVIE